MINEYKIMEQLGVGRDWMGRRALVEILAMCPTLGRAQAAAKRDE